MNINLPKNVELIISTLEDIGFEAYVVGGCVRDSLLNIEPKDWDICTNALPNEVLECFKSFRVIETGLQHGTVTVMIDNVGYEITSYRIDGEYKDNRHPENVIFTSSLESDLARRDFTMNAMAYNYKKGLIDYFNGQGNLILGFIQCVGHPDERFEEDALRILRALRFASVYNFRISDAVNLSILYKKNLLKNISEERKQSELCKLICGNGAKRILEQYAEVFNIIIPEINPMVGFSQCNPYHIYDVWEHTIVAIDHSEKDLIVRLALLFHDMGKPECFTQDENGGHFYKHSVVSERICRNRLTALKFDNNTINQVCELVLYHDFDVKINNKGIKKWLNKIGENSFRKLLDVKYADIMAHSEKSKYMLEYLPDIRIQLDKIIKDNQCFKLKDLMINGKDLKQLGILQGKGIGYILNNILLKVINDEIENNKDILIKYIKERWII